MQGHHALWNSQVRTPKRAQEQQSWRLVSIPDTPTYHYENGKGSSLLDLRLAAPSMAEEISNWAIDDGHATGSDHEVIRFQVVSTHPDLEGTTQEACLNWRKTDWDKFAKIIKTSSTETRPLWEQYRSDPSPTNLDTPDAANSAPHASHRRRTHFKPLWTLLQTETTFPLMEEMSTTIKALKRLCSSTSSRMSYARLSTLASDNTILSDHTSAES
jgi:hypothetical protein